MFILSIYKQNMTVIRAAVFVLIGLLVKLPSVYAEPNDPVVEFGPGGHIIGISNLQVEESTYNVEILSNVYTVFPTIDVSDTRAIDIIDGVMDTLKQEVQIVENGEIDPNLRSLTAESIEACQQIRQRRPAKCRFSMLTAGEDSGILKYTHVIKSVYSKRIKGWRIKERNRFGLAFDPAEDVLRRKEVLLKLTDVTQVECEAMFLPAASVSCPDPLATTVIQRSYIDESGNCPVIRDYPAEGGVEGFIYSTRHDRNIPQSFYLGVMVERVDSDGNTDGSSHIRARIAYDRTGLEDLIDPNTGLPYFREVTNDCPYQSGLGGFGAVEGDDFNISGSNGGQYTISDGGTSLLYVNPTVEINRVDIVPIP